MYKLDIGLNEILYTYPSFYVLYNIYTGSMIYLCMNHVDIQLYCILPIYYSIQIYLYVFLGDNFDRNFYLCTVMSDTK